MSNLRRRIQSLEAQFTEDSGLVPHHTKVDGPLDRVVQSAHARRESSRSLLNFEGRAVTTESL